VIAPAAVDGAVLEAVVARAAVHVIVPGPAVEAVGAAVAVELSSPLMPRRMSPPPPPRMVSAPFVPLRASPAAVPPSVAAKAAPVERTTIIATAATTRTIRPMPAPFVPAPGLSGCRDWNYEGATLHAGHGGMTFGERFGDVRVTTREPGTPRPAPLYRG
jgi:hypothetical protein